MKRAAVGLVVAAALAAACSVGDGASSSPTTPAPGSSAPATTAGGVATSAPATGAPATGAPATGVPATEPAATSAPATVALGSIRVRLATIAELDEPIALVARAGDDRLHIALRGGLVVAWRDGVVEDGPVLDMRSRTAAGGERGLLGMAYSADGTLLYVHYTNTGGDTRLDEYRMRADGTADPASRRELLAVEQPFSNHNGGHVVVGPDGMLYVGLGDGGSGGDPLGSGQDLGSLLGKLLRLDPRPGSGSPYTVPADNPFVGRAGARGEVWSFGLRNPWRYSFDRATGDLWLGDVGQGSREEVDVALAADGAGRGANFGWNRFEGSRPYEGGGDRDGLVFPVYEYGHDDGCSITGGVVYRGSAIPALAGRYLFADYCGDWVRVLDPATGEVGDLGVEVRQVASFGEDAAGEVYVLSLAGDVSRLVPA